MPMQSPINLGAFPKVMYEYFDLSWDREQLWEQALETCTGDMRAFAWHLDCPFWASAPPRHVFDLCPREVLADPTCYPEQYGRVLRADVTFPVEVALFGSLLVILDGLHRLASLSAQKASVIQFRVTPRERLRPIPPTPPGRNE